MITVENVNLAYVLGSTVGAIGHWVIKWLNDEVHCIFDMARTEQKRTVASIAAQIVASYVVVNSGQIELLTVTAAFIAGVMQGGSIDAFINKGRRCNWSEEKRLVRQMKELE